MTRITVTRTIDAPVEIVFGTVSDIRELARANPQIVDHEVLSERPTGVGARFRETRETDGKKETTELEIVEYEPNLRVRMVADSHGTIWDSTFRCVEQGARTTLTVTMDARAYRLVPRFLNPLIKGLVEKAIARDVERIKAYCEERMLGGDPSRVETTT